MKTNKNQKLKVLLCSPLGKQGIGGIAKWTHHILSFYEKHNTQIILDYFYIDGQTVHQNMPIIKRIWYGLYKYIPFVLGLKQRVKNNNFDILHFTSSASIGLFRDYIALKIALYNKCKTVVHFHFGRIPALFETQTLERRWLEKVIRNANLVVVIDQKSYDTLVCAGYKNIRLLPNPLSPSIATLIEENKSIIRNPLKIVFAGHVVPTKGVVELVQSCKNIDGVQLELLGHITDEMRDKLIQLAGINADWLHIRGEQPIEEVIKEMLSAGVFVLPTYTEGFPNVIIESMACGCPIVTTPVGAIPEMLNIHTQDPCGICVEPKNIKQLQDAIHKMLSDINFANKCGINAKRRVNSLYSMPQIWDALVQIWKDTNNK